MIVLKEMKHKQPCLQLFQTIIAMTGHGEYVFSKMPSSEVMSIVEGVFKGLGFNTSVLHFDSGLEGKAFEKQDAYRLWHLSLFV